ncbi:MAG: hypothetical protein AB1762_03465, partial [Gemmatimonadota bacterium]
MIRTFRHVALGAIVALSATTVNAQSMSHASNSGSTMTVAMLKAKLNTLLSEHVYLAAATTGSALGGRQAEFQAAAGALDKNSVDVSKAIGLVY